MCSAAALESVVFLPAHTNPKLLKRNPTQIPSDMWRSTARRAAYSSRKSISSFLGFSKDAVLLEKTRVLDLRTLLNSRHAEMGHRRNGELSHFLAFSGYPFGRTGGSIADLRGLASVAEAVSSTDIDEDSSSIEEIQGMLEELRKKEANGAGGRRFSLQDSHQRQQMEQKQLPRPMVHGMGSGKYQMLRRRQIKIETEAWEQAAKEYKELLTDMCEQKLAPNLPYVKSLFLGWFEPLRDQIAMEQAACQDPRNRAAHGPYFDQLPAEMMAVITMHKLMSLLMTGGENGSVRVVQAACQIGEAIEHEVGKILSAIIPHFLPSLDSLIY